MQYLSVLLLLQVLFGSICSCKEIVQDGSYFGIGSTNPRNKRATIGDESAIVNGNTKRFFLPLTPFICKVHQEISRSGNGSDNSVWSPFGLSAVLGMVWAGAGGSTAIEMKTILGLNGLKDQEILRKFRAIGKSRTSGKEAHFSIGNKAFASKFPNFAIRNRYKKRLRQIFRGGVEKINFQDAQNAANEINNWVKKETEEKIETIIGADSIKPETRMVLVNAIYFKGKWETPFPTQNTREMPFYINNSVAQTSAKSEEQFVEIPFMSVRSRFSYGIVNELNVNAVKIPYKGGRFSMVAILPDRATDISNLEMKLTQGFQLTSIVSKLSEGDLLLTLPKFKIESENSFEETLIKVGIGEIFSRIRANFSQITAANDVFVSEILQKTFIDVTEEGTEAAAVTTAIFHARSMPKRLSFNRPFIGFIFDEKTNSIMFMFRKGQSFSFGLRHISSPNNISAKVFEPC